ncbi:helix-turn-helix domain-containing protein [Phytohabitans rumicis]|uniref:helix-turn-helix domain-containing protein n=1 Tax=Phytohabitans rumicis TaxID=1076125 RepID=UPI001C49B7D2|nr:XRE family transcriptional regulator [Phytohabitans rumicis]
MSVERLGATIRRRRRDLGLTLVDVAARAGLSHPFLSQVERGLAQPSMRSLTALAAALETTAQALLALSGTAPVSLVRGGTPLPKLDIAGGKVRSLVQGERAMLPLEFTGAPAEFEEYYVHDGEEFLYVVDGTIEVDVEGELSHLSGGDSLYYAGGLRHRWRQVDTGPVKVVLVQHNVLRDRNAGDTAAG